MSQETNPRLISEGKSLYNQAKSAEDKTIKIDLFMKLHGYNPDSRDWANLVRRLGIDSGSIGVQNPRGVIFELAIFPQDATFPNEPSLVLEGHPCSCLSLERGLGDVSDPDINIRYNLEVDYFGLQEEKNDIETLGYSFRLLPSGQMTKRRVELKEDRDQEDQNAINPFNIWGPVGFKDLELIGISLRFINNRLNYGIEMAANYPN